MKRIKILITFIFLAIIGMAQNQEWTIVSSNITFKIKNAGFTVDGKFTGLTGYILFDPNKTSGNKIEGTIFSKTINTGNSKRDEHLKKEEYLYADKFLTINMSSPYFIKETSTTFKSIFTLTIKGITNTVPVEFTFTENDGKAKFAGSFTVNRLDYKVGSSSFILSDNVTINIEAICIKK